MKIEYLFSTPDGDITLGPDDLNSPFLIAPDKQHPFLNLGHYFLSIERFLFHERGGRLNMVLAEHYPEIHNLDKVQEIAITSEKHGAFYHIARVKLLTESASCCLAITAAVTKNSRKSLTKEFARLDYLHKKRDLPYLPEVYCYGREKLRAPDGATSLAFVLGQWFTGYYEWHLSVDETDNTQKIRLWDTDAGNRFLSENEANDLIRKAAKILTLYYDARTFKQITLWHHAAGDFIAKSENGKIDVRLITARGYESLPGFSPGEGTGMEIPLVVFFLNLTVRLRLDRLDGVGASAWIGQFAVHAAIRGFFEALTIHEAESRLQTGFTDDFHSLLKSFTIDDVLEIYQQIVTSNEQEDPEDLTLVKKQLPEHCRQLCLELERIP